VPTKYMAKKRVKPTLARDKVTEIQRNPLYRIKIDGSGDPKRRK